MTATTRIGGLDMQSHLASPLGRRFGWFAMLAAVASSMPPVLIAMSVFRDWDRVAQTPTPLWVLPLVWLCYAAFPLELLCVGSGLLTGRVERAARGGLALVATLIVLVTLFNVFD
jgi:hypothetical protein